MNTNGKLRISIVYSLPVILLSNLMLFCMSGCYSKKSHRSHSYLPLAVIAYTAHLFGGSDNIKPTPMPFAERLVPDCKNKGITFSATLDLNIIEQSSLLDIRKTNEIRLGKSPTEKSSEDIKQGQKTYNRIPEVPFGFENKKWEHFKSKIRPDDTLHHIAKLPGQKGLTSYTGYAIVRKDIVSAIFVTIDGSEYMSGWPDN